MDTENTPKGVTLCLPKTTIERLKEEAFENGTSFSAQVQRRVLAARKRGFKFNQPKALERDRDSVCVSLRPEEIQWLDTEIAAGNLYSRATGVALIVERDGKKAKRVGAKKAA